MIKQSDVTIIIPHLGKSPESRYALGECLDSLCRTVPEMKKILVINGHEFQDDLQLLNKEVIISNLTIMTLEEQGQCKAVNAAVATTNTPWIFVTNDDMIYAPGWFEALQSFFMEKEKHDKVLCISPQLVEPRVGAPTFKVEFCGGAGGDFDKEKWLRYSQFMAQGYSVRTGFNLPFLIRRDLWDTVGGYDINYDPWGSNSDSDLEYKIKLAGVQPYQNKNCLVYHFSQTSGTFNPENNEYYQKNFQVFRDKWGFDRTDDGIWEATFNIPTKEEGRIFNPPWESKYGRLS